MSGWLHSLARDSESRSISPRVPPGDWKYANVFYESAN
ncbi:hypothetical protein HTIA_1304 [Halorhabdus tiamatea SARL4B]|uniref:Uncharacterized protein n=1 Tax=Halorhabdus tiamatea SARL4B TaxID=1033806 RepID=S6D0G6_9EURY|nr:hypothetical protein HTIA_1304 [Halorhabdus tiamatea SARL4B]